MPPSNGDEGGPVICARIFVMSDGSGVYAAIPGGGSLDSKDISRIRRAFDAGEMLMFVVIDRWVQVVFPYCCCCFSLLC